MTMMNENNQIMRSLLRTAIWGEECFPFPADESADWAAICDELRMQTVSAFQVEVMSRVSEEMNNISFQSAAKNVSVWYALMQEHGYAVENLKNPRHAGLRKNEIEFELHRYFSTFNQKDCLYLLDGMIFDAIGEAKREEIEGFAFPMLPSLENGLMLFAHINQHLETRLGLRQIIDWMLYADHELNDEYYQKIFQPVIRQLGLEKLAVTATRMCQISLGLSENITWCRGAEADPCHTLMELTLQRGMPDMEGAG